MDAALCKARDTWGSIAANPLGLRLLEMRIPGRACWIGRAAFILMVPARHSDSPRTMTALRNPHAVILAGPNGAGKSTLAPRLLADTLSVRTFVNADVIAQGLAGFDPASAALEAGRIMLRRLDELRRESADFAFETTLSGLAHQRTIRDLHASGYTTHLVYLWLPNAETAVERVRIRVRLGGHDIPEPDVRRRYTRSIRNFDRVYRRLVSSWSLIHGLRPLDQPSLPLIAEGAGNAVLNLVDHEAWKDLRNQLSTLEHAEMRDGEA
jgi:predicted ABC-type ATPase